MAEKSTRVFKVSSSKRGFVTPGIFRKLKSKRITLHFDNRSLKIPVLMYHSVGACENLTGAWAFLCTCKQHFERCLRYLWRRGFSSFTLTELYEYIRLGIPLPSKAIVLTFDDGFLDNWVFVYPLLQKYGFKGTLFVCPEFVDPSGKCRPTFSENTDGITEQGIQTWWGHLSWAEIKRMEQEGIMDVQCHTLTHTWYFKNRRIIDFRNPGDEYYWVTWNENPEVKYKWFTEYQITEAEYGRPIYEFAESIITRRYFDDRDLQNVLIQYVRSENPNTFFKNNGWRTKLFQLADSYRRKNKLNDRFETRIEYFDRLNKEIYFSKLIIEKKLSKTVSFLCWPRGKVNSTALQIASESGYIATTKTDISNVLIDCPATVHRISSYLDRRDFGKHSESWVGLLFFIIRINAFRGKVGFELAYSLIRLFGRSLRVVKGLVRKL